MWIGFTSHIIRWTQTIDLIEPSGEFYKTSLTGENISVGLHVPKDSEIGQYFERFWLGEVADFFIPIRTDPNVATLMFEQFPDTFATEYAATNFDADFSETLLQFILTPEQPSPDGTIRTEKIRYLWTLPDLVLMRMDVRARL